MLIKTLLRGFVVVGGNTQDGIGTTQVKFAQLVQDLARRVTTATHHQRHTTIDFVSRVHRNHGTFGVIEGRRLGRCAEGYDVIHTSLDDIIDHIAKGLVIDLSLLGKGGNHGDTHAGKFFF